MDLRMLCAWHIEHCRCGMVIDLLCLPASPVVFKPILGQHLCTTCCGVGYAVGTPCWILPPRFLEAAECFKRALAIKAPAKRLHFYMGYCLSHAGHAAEAVASLRAAVHADPCKCAVCCVLPDSVFWRLCTTYLLCLCCSGAPFPSQ